MQPNQRRSPDQPHGPLTGIEGWPHQNEDEKTPLLRLCSKDTFGNLIPIYSTEGLDPVQQVAYLDHNVSRWDWAGPIGMSIDVRYNN